MKILNFGSLNIDYIYQVKEFVVEGETIASTAFNKNIGGKGLNQAIALSRVSNNVYFAGKVGQDGKFLVNELYDNNVNTEYIGVSKKITGHAVIQVNDKGQNCIITHGGANHDMDKQYIDVVIEMFKKGDLLIIQNEVNMVDYIIQKAEHRGLKVIYNPSPLTSVIDNVDFNHLEYLVINLNEGKAITKKTEPLEIIESLHSSYPKLKIILTASENGSYYKDEKESIFVPAHKVKAVDTTCAGDTYLGFFLGGIINKKGIKESMELATKAASIAIGRSGASRTIPTLDELE